MREVPEIRAEDVQIVVRRARVVRVGRKPSRLSRALSALLRLLPPGRHDKTRVRGRLEQLQHLRRLDRAGEDAP